MTVAIIAAVLAAPVILLPLALIAYINIGGVLEAVKAARRTKTAHTVTI